MKKILLTFILSLSTYAFASEAPPQKLTLMLNGSISPDHAPIVIAQEQGFFKEEGLEVSLLTPSMAVNVGNHIVNGQADLGITYEPTLIEEIDKGSPLIRVGTLIDKPLSCLVVLNKNGSTSLKDLTGNEIGSTHNTLANAMVMSMLASQGVTNIKMNPSKQDLTQALLTQKIRAATGMNRNTQIPMLEQKGLKFTTYFPEEHGVPTYSELIIVTKTTNVKDARIPRFLAALKKAVAYLDAHPNEAWDAFAKSYPTLNKPAIRTAWFNTMPYFAEDPAEFDGKEWEQFAKYLQNNKLISKAESASHYAVIIR